MAIPIKFLLTHFYTCTKEEKAPYIVCMISICIGREYMKVTVTHKKNIIELKDDTFKILSVMAVRQGTNLKQSIEMVGILL